MSRDIKFRAWHKEQGMTKTPVLKRNDFSGEVHCEGHTKAGEPFLLPLMQYTGMKDRKGNDIYEGDIIECDDEYCPWWIVFWSDLNGGWYIECGDDSLQLVETACYDVVVGNIHENPELLQNKAS